MSATDSSASTEATAPSTDIHTQVESVLQEVREFDEKIEERNQKRLLLIQQLGDLLPEEQFHRFEAILNSTVEAVKPSPDPATIPPVVIDEQNPLESLRDIRTRIAQEVCQVMGVPAPSL